jgi:sRNA-binding carbon storage regulator CsrA
MGNLVLTRRPGESIDVYDPNNAALGVIVITQGKITGKHSSIAIDAPRHLAIKRSELGGKGPEQVSEPVTKKLSEILLERPHLKVTGIRRRDAHCEQAENVLARLGRLHLEMTWHDNWHAWSNRPATGIYQQLIIFVPRSSDE